MKPASLVSLAFLTVFMAGCYTSEVSPDYARHANASLAAQEKTEQQALPADQKESMQRLWADVPEYAAWLKGERKLKKMPRLVSSSVPSYPVIPLLAGVKARVVVSFVVSRSGSVEAARILESSDSRFEQSALDSVRKWKFLPAEFEEGPTIVVMATPIEFAGKK